MARPRHQRSKAFGSPRTKRPAVVPVGLRIIGGSLRGRTLRYSGDPAVRPMKDRVREAVFNLLGPSVAGKHAVDLFAGTGALGLEAISRGAAKATLIEQHYPTARLLQQNIAALGVQDRAEVVTGNVFVRALWHHRLSLSAPWLVFSSPPYAFYVERKQQMLDLLHHLAEAAPAASLFVVESDERFDFTFLPDPRSWHIRSYPPAVIGIYSKGCDIRPKAES